MKVVLFIYSMNSGGAERVSANLANAWAEQGHDVTVLTLASAALDFYELRFNVKRVALDLAGNSSGPHTALWANLHRVFAVRRVLRELQADVVLAMMTAAAVLAILATRGMNCQVLVSERVHPPMYPVGRMWDWLRRQTYPFADRVVMQATEGLVWLNECIPGATGVVIPNPVSFPLEATSQKLTPSAHISAQRNLLLAVGRLEKQKGFDLLIEAFGLLVRTYPQWDLIILGEGPERGRLERQVQQLGFVERIHLPGRAGNVGDWYVRASLYVMSSRFEGFPNTLTEAMAHGCAAVSYDCESGPRDIIRPERDGLLVSPVGNVPALAGALGRLMGDEVQRLEMSRQAVQVRTRFSLHKILSMWEQLFFGDSMKHKDEMEAKSRFGFGENWSRFLNVLDERRIQVAEQSLRNMLELDTLAGQRFLDIGSGSGLFSLAARRLGATVHSFDYDPRSVACTTELRHRYFPDDPQWVVEEGSILDQEYLGRLGKFDIIYSWGVLHHTGAMWEAFENLLSLFEKSTGKLFIAIYNDQGGWSRRWKAIKKIYNLLPTWLRTVYAIFIIIPREFRSLMTHAANGRFLYYFIHIRNYSTISQRGMNWWCDKIDWIGGYPFEVAKPEEVFNFFKLKKFRLTKLVTCGGGLGCNEFVFNK